MYAENGLVRVYALIWLIHELSESRRFINEAKVYLAISIECLESIL